MWSHDFDHFFTTNNCTDDFPHVWSSKALSEVKRTPAGVLNSLLRAGDECKTGPTQSCYICGGVTATKDLSE